MSQLDEQSVVPSTTSPPGSGADGAEDGELSDAALDAVVGGLSVEAAFLRAAAFDAGRNG